MPVVFALPAQDANRPSDHRRPLDFRFLESRAQDRLPAVGVARNRWAIGHRSVTSGGFAVDHRIVFRKWIAAAAFRIWTWVAILLSPSRNHEATTRYSWYWEFGGDMNAHRVERVFLMTAQKVERERIAPAWAVAHVVTGLGGHSTTQSWGEAKRPRSVRADGGWWDAAQLRYEYRPSELVRTAAYAAIRW